jgi:hypothetical protein
MLVPIVGPQRALPTPPERAYHTAIWTGSEMILWGGWNDQDFFNTGGSYNPGKDSWIATSMTNVPMVDSSTRRCGLAMK